MVKEHYFKDQEVIKSTELETSEEKELKIVRRFHAPKELLYKAFIDPLYLQKWWGTYHCQKSICKVNPVVGGEISILMTMLGGKEVFLKGEFHELIENERIVFTIGPADDSAKDFYVVNRKTGVIEENNGNTNLNLSVKMVKAAGARTGSAFQGMLKGWPESLTRLEECLKLDLVDRP